MVNEAYTVIKALGYDRNGAVLKVAEVLPDGRIRFEQDMGRQALILQRSSDLLGADLKAGDEVRIEPTHRIAIEKFENRQARTHLLDEVPSVTWEQIGGQHQAIEAIRKAIESAAPRRHLHEISIHAAEGLPALWPAGLRQDLDRAGRSCQPASARP